jgi:DNA-binding winged helix-turn-helix (wHTH) protein
MGQNHTGYRFGEFMLDPRTGTVTGPGGEVVLRRKNFLLLEALLAHAPALMSRDRLLDLVWGHDALSPNVLPQAMSELRQALGDDPQAPRYIETRHRRGYRMVCPVEQVDTDADGQRGGLAGGDPPAGTLVDSKGDGGGGPVPPGRTTATEAGAPGDARARWWSRRRQLIAAGLAIVIAGGSVALVGHQWQRQSDWRQLHHGILPQARALVETDLFGAYRLLREARSRVSGDPVLEQAWRDITLPVAIESQPQGALSGSAVTARPNRNGSRWDGRRWPMSASRSPRCACGRNWMATILSSWHRACCLRRNRSTCTVPDRRPRAWSTCRPARWSSWVRVRTWMHSGWTAAR